MFSLFKANWAISQRLRFRVATTLDWEWCASHPKSWELFPCRHQSRGAKDTKREYSHFLHQMTSLIYKFIPAVAFLRKVTEGILWGAKVFFHLGFPHLFLRSILLCRVLPVLERSSQKMSTLWEKQLRPQFQQLLFQQLNLKFYSTSCWMFFMCLYPNVEGQEVVTSVMSDVFTRIRVES